jgi:uncharacterized membrane protein (UPF0127 family)
MIIHRVEHNRRRVPVDVEVCESRFERSRGLLLRRCPDHRTAMMRKPCSMVHTVGMIYRIDVLFCDDDNRILRIVEALAPFRFARCPGASHVWEAQAGFAAHWGWQVGDRITPWW